MKYKYFLMLILFNVFSFLTLSSENKETILEKMDCKKMCRKYNKPAKPVSADYSQIEFSPVNQFLTFM